MKKDQNRSDHQVTNSSLPRSRILRGKKNFERLFQRSTLLTQTAIQFRYRIYQDPSEGILIAFIAPKRKIKGAVARNRMKRWLRESYRTHQQLLRDTINDYGLGFHAAFIVNDSAVEFSAIREEVVILVERAVKNIKKRQIQTESGNVTVDPNHNR